MQVVLTSNNPVTISYARHLLDEQGIESFLFDAHTSVIEGSIGAIPRRLMVIDDDLTRARQILKEANLS